MAKCKKCSVPLSGFLSHIPKKIFGVKPSEKAPGLCNKCEPKEGKYCCQICGREIDEAVALSHVKAEEYLLELIRRDHPEWKTHDNACNTCLAYYRRLIKETEI